MVNFCMANVIPSRNALMCGSQQKRRFFQKIFACKVCRFDLPRNGRCHGELSNDSRFQAAGKADFGREFLSLKCAVKVVRDIDEALAHIQQYSTKHSEAIVSENKSICNRFLHDVDAAVVYMNASTRFTDGEEFGLGAEIGISTQKLHARGPFALEKLVTEKWIIKGNGQVR